VELKTISIFFAWSPKELCLVKFMEKLEANSRVKGSGKNKFGFSLAGCYASFTRGLSTHRYFCVALRAFGQRAKRYFSAFLRGVTRPIRYFSVALRAFGQRAEGEEIYFPHFTRAYAPIAIYVSP
jgi:hypothetical protein